MAASLVVRAGATGDQKGIGVGVVVAILLVLVLVGRVTGGHDDASSSSSSAASTSLAHVRLDTSSSWCFANPLDARIRVQVTLVNRGSDDAKVSVLPIRRYSDGTTNDSPLDEMLDLSVPPYETKRFFNDYDYNAERHDLLECSVRVDRGRGLGAPAFLSVQ